MVLLFDALASQHYYFLSEFEFTENIEWRPKQYDFLSKLNPYFDINKRRKEYKAFKELYNLVEDLFLNFTMSLRANGLEPCELSAKGDKEFVKLVESVSSLFKDNIAIWYDKADVVIGCGTFISLTDFPLDLAFQYSGIDVGQCSYTSTQKPVTVNPFMLYWLITSFFQYKNGIVIPNYVTVEIDNIPPTVQFLNVKELKIHTYNPSEIVSKVFISAKGAEFIKEYLKELFDNPLYNKNKPLVLDTNV